jgi:hypothetical protein
VENSEVFLDDFFDSFFVEVTKGSFYPGQLFWTHVCYDITEDLQVWRPVLQDDSETIASQFQIKSVSIKEAFNRNIPLYAPKLETDEEFLVVRAKKRPVVLLSEPLPGIKADPVRRGDKVNRNICFVAPLYSIVDQHEKPKYSQNFVNRVRKLEFPHFLFIPANKRFAIRDSILRLDSLRPVFKSHLDPIDLRLSDDIMKVLRGQIQFVLTGKSETDYHDVRELLLQQ